MGKKDSNKNKNIDDFDDAETNLMMETLPKEKSKKSEPASGGATKTAKSGKERKSGMGALVGKKVSLLGRLDSCNNCIRYILVVGNCIFFLLGCTIIGLGIYVVVDKVNFVTGLFGLTLVAPASYLILASGCVVFIISFIGCFGALFESRLLLAIYSGFLAVVLALSCIGFSLTVILRSNVTDQIRLYMRRTVLYDYGINMDQQWNVFVTKKWDQAQIKWQCCAVQDNTWPLYMESAWYKSNRKKTIKKNIKDNNLKWNDNNNDNNKGVVVENTNKNKNLSTSYNNKNSNRSDDFSHIFDDQTLSDITDFVSLVPKSCCRITPDGQYSDLKTCRRGMEFFREQGLNDPDLIANSSSSFTDSINTKGCYAEGTTVMDEISRYLICIGVITAVVVIGGLVISIQLTRHI